MNLLRLVMKRAIDAMFRDSTSLTELGMAGADSVWAWVLLISNPDLLQSTAAHTSINTDIPQWVIGASFGCIALLKLAGWIAERPLITAVGAVPAVGLWIFVAYGLSQAPTPQPTGVGIYALAAAASAIIGLRAVTRLRDRARQRRREY